MEEENDVEAASKITVYRTRTGVFLVESIEEREMAAPRHMHLPENFGEFGHKTLKVAVPTLKVVDGIENLIADVSARLDLGHGRMKVLNSMPVHSMSHSRMVPGAEFEATILEVAGGYVAKVMGYDDETAEADESESESEVFGEKIPAWARRALDTMIERMHSVDEATYAFVTREALLAFLRKAAPAPVVTA